MLKESVAAVLFTAVICGVAAQTPITISAADKDEIVRAHNFVRRGVMPTATNMEVMMYNEELAGIAQAYSLNCQFGRSNTVSSPSFSFIGENNFLAENVTVNYTSFIVDSWANTESPYYDYATNTCNPPPTGGACGHYRQVVWHSTDNVGCGATRCPTVNISVGVQYRDAVLFICNFGPEGNIVGERPYKNGTPCSNCPSNKPYCEANLCTQQAPITEAPSPTTPEATTEAPSPTTPEATTEAPSSPTTEPSSLPTPEATTEAPSPTTPEATTEAPTSITETPTMPAPTDSVTGCPTQNHHPLFPGSGISYNWTDTVAGSSHYIPCSGLRSCQEMAGVSGGMIVRRCSAQAEWLMVDFSGCGLSVTTLHLCEVSQQIASDTESAAMVIVKITANASELGASAISAATSIVEELTAAAIDQPEVRQHYLQLINNLLEAIPDNILESQRQANSSTRLLQSLRRFANTVPIPANSTNNTLAFPLDNFALLLRDINPESFSGESFSVNLGPVEEAIRNSSGINEEVLVTMMDPLPSATASVELSQSLFDGNSTYASLRQRIVYNVFLTNALFLTLDTNCENSTIGSIILGVDVNSSVTNISMSTGEIQLAFQQFRMACNDQIPPQSTAICSNFARKGQYGRWSMDSCRVVSDDGATTRCVCTQLGHFGLLFDLDPGDVYEPGAIFLAAVTYIGTTISVLCLVVTVITYTVFKKHRFSEQSSAGIHGQLLINLSCSLIGVYVTFIVAGLVTTIPPLCGVVAALLQYFMLVFFGWTAVEALFLYQKLVRNVLGQISPYFVPIAAAVVWLVPIVVVGISAGAGHRYYVNPFYCRIIMYPFWFGLIFPCVAVYLFNWAMFIIIIVCIVKNRKNIHHKKRELKRLFFLALGLSLLFGLGWGFGLLATSSDITELTFTFQILFSILIGSQGLLIFIFHVIRAPQARKQWKKLFFKFSSNKSLRSHTVSSSKSPKTSYPMPSINLSGENNSTLKKGEEGEKAVSIT